MKRVAFLLVALGFAPAALAYIGPGAGISLLGSLFSIVGAIFLAIFAILMWPIRKVFKRRKKKRKASETTDSPETAEPVAQATSSEATEDA